MGWFSSKKTCKWCKKELSDGQSEDRCPERPGASTSSSRSESASTVRSKTCMKCKRSFVYHDAGETLLPRCPHCGF